MDVVHQVEDTERLWGGCVLYVVKALSCGATVDGDKSESNAVGFTLSQLMRQTKIRHARELDMISICAITECLLVSIAFCDTSFVHKISFHTANEY